MLCDDCGRQRWVCLHSLPGLMLLHHPSTKTMLRLFENIQAMHCQAKRNGTIFPPAHAKTEADGGNNSSIQTLLFLSLFLDETVLLLIIDGLNDCDVDANRSSLKSLRDLGSLPYLQLSSPISAVVRPEVRVQGTARLRNHQQPILLHYISKNFLSLPHLFTSSLCAHFSAVFSDLPLVVTPTRPRPVGKPHLAQAGCQAQRQPLLCTPQQYHRQHYPAPCPKTPGTRSTT